MFAHRDAKLIYLAHYKTGSNSTVSSLKRVGFEQVTDDHHAGIWDASELDPLWFTGFERGNWTAFTTVRNPWDLAISWAIANMRAAGLLAEIPAVFTPKQLAAALALDSYCAPRDRFCWQHVDEADVILHFEDLPDALESLLNFHALELVDWSHRLKDPTRDGRPYQPFYSLDSRRYIGERFKAEIDRHGYRFLNV